MEKYLLGGRSARSEQLDGLSSISIDSNGQDAPISTPIGDGDGPVGYVTSGNGHIEGRVQT
jgi:hypothetical protein